MSNEVKKLSAAFFFVDIRDSSKLIASVGPEKGVRIYRTFIEATTIVVKDCGGKIRSFNGDGLLAVFDEFGFPRPKHVEGERACGQAVRAALKLVAVLRNIARPSLSESLVLKGFPTVELPLDWGIGISYGEILVARAGEKGSSNNDLVWIGNPPNLAVKLASHGRDPEHLLVDASVFERLEHSLLTFQNGSSAWNDRGQSLIGTTGLIRGTTGSIEVE